MRILASSLADNRIRNSHVNKHTCMYLCVQRLVFTLLQSQDADMCLFVLFGLRRTRAKRVLCLQR
jgi:hypothetical protein